MNDILYIVIPCYNEEQVLPITAPLFLAELRELREAGKISPDSRILFVDDGSTDGTWACISRLAREDVHFLGIRLSRNRGHQNALLAGLMEAMDRADASISIDCDGQDDIRAMGAMVDAWQTGNDVVYGVRSRRDTDNWFKRNTAKWYYRFLAAMGVEVVFNHADYRLLSARAMRGLAEFREVHLFLRGMVPLAGFPSATVPYVRRERMAGKTHYPLSKMLALAFNGITSLSMRPLRWITGMGCVLTLLGLLGGAVSLCAGDGQNVLLSAVFFVGGLQILSLGIVGEYVGRTYMEAKARPRYLIRERTWEQESGNGETGQRTGINIT